MSVSNELWAKTWWQVTEKNNEWLKENKDELMSSANYSFKRKWFVPAGFPARQWPLLCLSVWSESHREPKGVHISVSYKESEDGWFCECSLPKPLTYILIEMLENIDGAFDNLGNE